MKILLTGASGLLGSAVARLAGARGHEVAGISGSWGGAVPGVARGSALDLTQPGALEPLWQQEAPAVVINAAAVADPAACEADPAGSYALNVTLPARLAQLAADTGARLLHLSSEQVFDGERAPYAITALPAPLHRYGRQKAESEQVVLAASPAAAVVRAPLLLGNSLGGRRGLHEKLFEQWAAGRPARLYTDEIRQVCSVDNLAAVLLELAERHDLTGIFHWAGAQPVSRWAMGGAIARHFGVGAGWLEPVARAATPAVSALRPRDLTLSLAPLDRELRTRPESLAEAVRGLVVPEAYRGWLEQTGTGPRPGPA